MAKSATAILRQLFSEQQFIPGAPADEYDCLVRSIISSLYKDDPSQADLEQLIAGELRRHFNVKVPRLKISAVAEEIIRLRK